MCAWRFQDYSHAKSQPPDYYSRNRLYPNAKSPIEVPTRTSRRLSESMSLTHNLGLDTTSDDINASAYSSPYYINGRFNSLNVVTQRGNSSSVQGCKFLTSVKDTTSDFSTSDIQTTLTLWQGKQIKFEVPYSGKIVGNTVTLKNTDGCTGILSIYLSTTDGGEPIYETAIDLAKVSTHKFEHFTLRGITPVGAKANPLGKIYVRMEISGELSSKRGTNPFNTGRKIEIAATGEGSHYAASVRLGTKNTIANGESYEYVRLPNRPLIGFIHNDYTSVPVDCIANEKTGASVSDRGVRYDIFCIKDATHAEIIVYNPDLNEVISAPNIKIDSRTEQVYIAQAIGPDRKNYVYYVDGYSSLQRFEIGKWASEEVRSVQRQDDNDYESDAKIGASLLMFHHNRLYVGGFLNDKNLWQCSTIEADGPDYTTYTNKWYVPDISPLASTLNPPTAVVEHTTDSIMILGRNMYAIFATNVAIENPEESKYTGTPTQVSTFTDSAGVLSQGDVCSYKGVIYSFDAKEGIRRYSGSKWTVIPNSVKSHFDRVNLDKPRKMWGYANKLYFNYTDKIDGKAKCLVWDMEMNYQQYPWFQDVDIPFCDCRTDETEVIIGIHPDYPCIMELYAEDVWRRLDSPIIFERHTKYLNLPGNAADMIVKRVHNKVLANQDQWWYFGLAGDSQKLRQVRGLDYWYRMPCWATEDRNEPVEAPFSSQDIYEAKASLRLTINNINLRCSAIQCKIMSKTFRAQASLLMTQFEVAPAQFL